LGELHRPPEPIVIGERERRVAEPGGWFARSIGVEAPSRKEKAEWACSSM
jgi:hypothetical protein